MNSRAWTEVAAGAQARSTRLWLRNSALPMISRYLLLLVLVAAAALLFFPMFVPRAYEYGQWHSHCALGCHSQVPARFENSPRDLLDLIF